MLGIHVYFNNGCEMECKDVVNTRHFLTLSVKMVYTNQPRTVLYALFDNPMRVLRVEFTRTPNNERS